MGNNNLPKPLKGLRFLGYEVTRSEFIVYKKQLDKEGGYLNQTFNTDFEYEKDKFNVIAILQIDAFEKDEQSDEGDHASDDKVFSVGIDITLRFSTKETESSNSQLKRYEWHFQHQALILLQSMLKDIMKDSRFKIDPSITMQE